MEWENSRAERASEEKLFRNLCLYITTGCFVEKRDLISLSLFFRDVNTRRGGRRNDRVAGHYYYRSSLVSNVNVES